MKSRIKLSLIVAVLFSILLGLVEGCSKKDEQEPSQTRPAQKRVEEADEDF